MLAARRNYVYEVKVNKDDLDREKIVSKEFLEKCKAIAIKYPKR